MHVKFFNVDIIDKQLDRAAQKPVLPSNVRACVLCGEPLNDGVCPVCRPKMHVIGRKAVAFFTGQLVEPSIAIYLSIALVLAVVLAVGGPQILAGL